MSSNSYSQKSGLKNHTNEGIFQVMSGHDQVMKIHTNERIFQIMTSL